MLLGKAGVSSIVSDHVATLRDFGTGKRSIPDLLLFFGVPLIGATATVWIGVRIRISAITAILTASAIFIGLLPNLLVLVLTFLGNLKGDASTDLQNRKQFMREISAHVSFSFVLSLLLAATATVALVFLPKDADPLGAVLTFLLVGGSLMLLLTLLMLIRRMHDLVMSEFTHHKFDRPIRKAS